MKEVRFEKGVIVSSEGNLCAYGDRQCGISCPHFEYIKKGYRKIITDEFDRPITTVGVEPAIIITCSGSPVALRVKEG